jgi:hypothetical protein
LEKYKYIKQDFSIKTSLTIEKLTKKKEKETDFDKQINYFGIEILRNIESEREREREMIGDLNRTSLALALAVGAGIGNGVVCRGVTGTCDVVFGAGVGVGVNLGRVLGLGLLVLGQIVHAHTLPHRVHHHPHPEQHELPCAARVSATRARHLRFTLF